MPFLSGRCIGALVCTLALTGCIVATVPSHTSAPPPPVHSPPVPVRPVSIDVEYFHDSLDPYGNWIWMEPQGWVWAPEEVDPYWRPYTVGRWAWSDYGWTWVSDEPWGWAAYHYGRWTRAPRYGWVWVPGNVWGPAWVAWRHGPGVVGWAPLPPQVGFSAHGGLDFGGVDINIAIQSSSWCFVDEVHIIEPAHRHLYPVGRNITVIRRTTPRARIVHREGRIYNDGYPREQAEHALRRPLPRYRVVDGDERHGGRDEVRGNEVRVWRPNVSERSGRPDPQRRGFGKPRDENLDHARETDKEPPPPRRQPPTQAPPTQPPAVQAPPTQAPPQVERRRMERGSEPDSNRPPEIRRREASQKPQDPPAQQQAAPPEPTAERERNGNAQGNASGEKQQQPGGQQMEKNQNAPKGQQADRAPTQREAEKGQPPAKGPAGKAGGKGKGKGKKAAQESSSDKSEDKSEEEKPQEEKPQQNSP